MFYFKSAEIDPNNILRLHIQFDRFPNKQCCKEKYISPCDVHRVIPLVHAPSCTIASEAVEMQWDYEAICHQRDPLHPRNVSCCQD